MNDRVFAGLFAGASLFAFGIGAPGAGAVALMCAFILWSMARPR